MLAETNGSYWGRYYAEGIAPELPSQFALFVANELSTGHLPMSRKFVDIGCGNGRDSLFFSQLGYEVIGIDQSDAAIEHCSERRGLDRNLSDRVKFMAAPVDETETWEKVRELHREGPLTLYARFLIHALDECAEERLLDNVGALLRIVGGSFCVEARSLEDRFEAKVTPEHYRRFIDPDGFSASLEQRGLRPIYRSEGRGMAKYCDDDARVFRVLATA